MAIRRNACGENATSATIASTMWVNPNVPLETSKDLTGLNQPNTRQYLRVQGLGLSGDWNSASDFIK